jgi:hypothetical protein
MAAFLNNSVDTFLEKFISEEKHDEAREEMQEMFASMAAQLGRDLFRNFKVVTNSGSDSDSDEKPKKKRASRKKKEDDSGENVEKVERPICTGLTAAGKPCKNKVVQKEDGTFEELCHIHLKKKNDPPKAKKEKVTKPKKEKVTKAKKTKAKKTPEHNHELSEEDTSDCDLCDTHGNKAVDGFEEEFELDGDTKSTLEAILAKASDSDSEEEVTEQLDEEDEEGWLAQQAAAGNDIPDLDEHGNDSPPRTRSKKSRPIPKSTRAV